MGTDRKPVLYRFEMTAGGTLVGLGAAALVLVPATHHSTAVLYRPYYTGQGRAISLDRPDSPHTDLMEPWIYQVPPGAGTARTTFIINPDSWAEQVYDEQYGPWRRSLPGD